MNLSAPLILKSLWKSEGRLYIFCKAVNLEQVLINEINCKATAPIRETSILSFCHEVGNACGKILEPRTET